jgi:hypothetical protein
MKKYQVVFMSLLLMVFIASCDVGGPDSISWDTPKDGGDFGTIPAECEENINNCLELTEPTFCELNYAAPCCHNSSLDDRCNTLPPQDLYNVCSNDPSNPWCLPINYPVEPRFGCSYKYGQKVKDSGDGTHDGLDIKSNRVPVPIYASWKGKIVAKLSEDDNSTTGNVVVVEYRYTDIPESQRPPSLKPGHSIYIYYGHQTDGGFKLKQLGDTVDAGQQFGEVGKTGAADGYHIHMEVRMGESGKSSTEEFAQSEGHIQWSKYGNRENPENIFPNICGK